MGKGGFSGFGQLIWSGYFGNSQGGTGAQRFDKERISQLLAGVEQRAF